MKLDNKNFEEIHQKAVDAFDQGDFLNALVLFQQAKSLDESLFNTMWSENEKLGLKYDLLFGVCRFGIKDFEASENNLKKIYGWENGEFKAVPEKIILKILPDVWTQMIKFKNEVKSLKEEIKNIKKSK